MSIFEAFILGLVQGLTEFLPISSSGHMIIFGKFLGIYEVPIAFELIMHLATLLAVIIVLRKEVFALIKKPFTKQTALLVTATVPTVIMAVIFSAFFRDAFKGEYLIFCFMITAILILVSSFVEEHISNNKPKMIKSEMSFVDAAIIGVAQGIAVMPGISRSGATICTAKMLGVSKEKSSSFSFLLSIPIIIGSSILEISANGSALGAEAPALIIGFLTAFVVGLIACKIMIKVVNSFSLNGFAYYLTALCVFMLVDKFFLHLL